MKKLLKMFGGRMKKLFNFFGKQQSPPSIRRSQSCKHILTSTEHCPPSVRRSQSCKYIPTSAEPQPPRSSLTFNWRNASSSVSPPATRFYSTDLQSLARSYDANELMAQLETLMSLKKWADARQLFEYWISSSKTNKPDVDIYNVFLRANLMLEESAHNLLNILWGMVGYRLTPIAASFNIVLEAMLQSRESKAAANLIDWMSKLGKDFNDSSPDYKSYNLVIKVHISCALIDDAITFMRRMLRCGYTLDETFFDCVQICVRDKRLDLVLEMVQKCKAIHQPTWDTCNYIVDVAKSANDDLYYCALEIMHTLNEQT